MRLFTIGFTQKSAEHFFTTLQRAGVKSVVDVRLNNRSQLAGFSKAADLKYFLRKIGDIGYGHLPQLAPTQEMLDRYKKNRGTWADYEKEFLSLITERRIEDQVDKRQFDCACLLCSEHEPKHCHRRLVAEYFAQRWDGLSVTHLM